MEVSDAHILSQFRNPSTREQGFQLLVSKYKERIYWQIRRMVNTHEDADDVVQNVLIKVWKYLDNYKGESQLHTWLYRIAYNESLTHIKQQKKRTSLDIDNEELGLGSKLKADSYISGDDIQMKLQQAIATLPDKQKMVFNMRYYEEMTYDEISEVVETSVGALKASYHHAVKKIEQFLKAD